MSPFQEIYQGIVCEDLATIGHGLVGYETMLAGARLARGSGAEVRYRNRPVPPIEWTYEFRLNPDLYIEAVVKKYGINLRGSGRTIRVKFNPNLASEGLSRQSTPDVIEVGPRAMTSEENLANTIAHELNHARSWLAGGNAPEDPAYNAGDALEDYIRGGR